MDAAQKESNFEDAAKFMPERWLAPEAKDYHPFASIPFGYGTRKCLGQNIAETMLSLLTVKVRSDEIFLIFYSHLQSVFAVQ